MPTILHLYAPCSKTLDETLTHFKVHPMPALSIEELVSPHQVLVVRDCFFADPRPLEGLPNPVIVIHSPHDCTSVLINYNK